jgi:predicted nucleotidyltransferase
MPRSFRLCTVFRSVYPEARIAIIGAAALGFHIPMFWRISADLDLVLAVAVADLSVLKLHGWERDPRQQQRWKAPSGALLDLLPAPPEVLATRELIWPETGHRMSMAGLALALAAEAVRLDAGLSIGLPSVPVIALLKMAAYSDRPYEREKDLKNLAHILNEYPPIKDDRLFSDEMFERNLDASQAQAFVLGRELAEVCAEPDRQIVASFLEMTEEGPHFSRFVNQSPWRNNEDELRRLLETLRDGFDQSASESTDAD